MEKTATQAHATCRPHIHDALECVMYHPEREVDVKDIYLHTTKTPLDMYVGGTYLQSNGLPGGRDLLHSEILFNHVLQQLQTPSLKVVVQSPSS